jgi:acyl-CoA synthetase (AMP-forming)/AMP-acid ligase II
LIGDRRQTSATQDLALSYSLSPSISQIECAMVTTLAEILPHAARIHGDRIALIVDDRQFSFRELDAMSNRVASGPAAIGINPGDRVSLFGPNSWEWLVSYYGIVKTGAVVNPLSSMLTPDEGALFSDRRRSACGRRLLGQGWHAARDGLPYPGNAFRVVDVDDAAKEMPRGERGELMYRGPLVMQGYYNNPQATAETIRPDGWLHMGDIATIDEDGYATIVDRKKDMIITAGFKIFPAEIERVLCMHPAIALAAVGSVTDEAKGELAKAYVILKPGAEVSRADLVAHCREHLAAYKVPRAVQFVASVPTTSSGKIMRRMLMEVDDGSFTVS